jgi:N-acetylglucosamine malate deacetylase 1
MDEKVSSNSFAAWLEFVNGHVALLESGKKIPGGESEIAPIAPPAAVPPLRVTLCSPHPDDEALTGTLPLRLRRELGAAVTNCAITLGSDLSRREGRRRELQSACRILGFGLLVPQEPGGLESVRVATRNEAPQAWAAMVGKLAQTFEQLQPDVVLAPHAEDFHPAHIGTHFLAVDALAAYAARSKQPAIPLIETSYWHEHARPNLMVGALPDIVATLVMATAAHAGEVARNAYHLRLPSRMIDSARRGAEVVGVVGGAAPAFPFAELYHLAFVGPGGILEPRPGGMIIGPQELMNWDPVIASFRPGAH